MKIKFKKIMSVISSVFLVGATVGMAAAAGGAFPTPFMKNNVVDTAIVYGTGSAVSDLTAANAINTYLKTFEQTSTSASSTTTYSASGDFSESEGIRDNEIPLGGLITNSDINTELGDNKISTLFDGEVKWDDGVDFKRYDLHEVISIGSGMKTQTTLENNEFETSVVLNNDQSLTYKLIFDDDFVLDRIGDYDDGDADELYLTILGKEYEVIKMESNSITVSLAEQITVEDGGSFIVDGTTLKVENIYDDTIQVNGKLIKEERTKTVDGIKVYVENIGYHLATGYTNKVVLKVGKDIEKEFEDGDEYIEDDETWEWTIENPGEVGGYIGVKYIRNSVGYDEDEDEDNAIGIGDGYVFPENYVGVFFNGLTDVDYENFELSFDDKKLYTGVDTSGIMTDVAILQGEKDESFELSNGWETDSLYFKYTEDGVELYFKDINGDVDDDKEGRIQYHESFDFGIVPITTNETVPEGELGTTYGNAPIEGYWYYDGAINHTVTKLIIGEKEFFVYDGLNEVPEGELGTTYGNAPIEGYWYYDGTTNHTVTKSGEDYLYEVTTEGSSEDVSYEDIATLIVDDTEVQLSLNLNVGNTVDLTLTNDDGVDISIPLGTPEDKFDRLGINKDSDSTDLVVEGKNIGNYEDDVMDHYGIIYKSPEYNADREKVIFEVPNEQVYADISVLGQGMEITNVTTNNETTTETPVSNFGAVIVKDSEINSVKDKNLIIVGGSCINAEAAKLLGGKACGADFTLKTGVVAGKALVKSIVSPYNVNKVAVIVAGYNAADTTKAANSIISSEMDLSVGQEHTI